ncbi:MAG TPA: porin [Accumulibacter sp.]|nr:porin [Accumulibacter sp.]
MQKKIIALAVASLASGAALAQTNVTVYGVADAGYIYSSGDTGRNGPILGGTNTFSGVQSGLLSGSRIGFKGEEALGNGLKAIFTLEYWVQLDNNTGIGSTGSSQNARQQFVGLSSDKLGTVALGRQYAPGYQAQINNDPLAGATFSPVVFLSGQAGNTIQGGSNARWDNGLTYTSPNWSGFTAKAIYSFGESNLGGYNNASTSDNGKFGIGGNYANGPLNIDLVYQTRQNVVTTFPTPVTQGNDINEGYIGASYDFKMVKIMGSYQQQNDKNTANLDNTVWSLGAVVPVMAASHVHLSYAQLEWDQGRYLLNNSSQSAALGWTTDLSKRTTLYAGYVWTKNDNHSTGNGPVAGIGAPGESNNTFLAGLRHSF